MHHWEPEYFDEKYDEKQAILNEIAKEEYIKLQQKFGKECKIYENRKRQKNDCVA